MKTKYRGEYRVELEYDLLSPEQKAQLRKRRKAKAYAALAFGVTLSTVCLLALPPYWREVAGNMIGVLFLLCAAVLCARWAIGNVKHPPL